MLREERKLSPAKAQPNFVQIEVRTSKPLARARRFDGMSDIAGDVSRYAESLLPLSLSLSCSAAPPAQKVSSSSRSKRTALEGRWKSRTDSAFGEQQCATPPHHGSLRMFIWLCMYHVTCITMSLGHKRRVETFVLRRLHLLKSMVKPTTM